MMSMSMPVITLIGLFVTGGGTIMSIQIAGAQYIDNNNTGTSLGNPFFLEKGRIIGQVLTRSNLPLGIWKILGLVLFLCLKLVCLNHSHSSSLFSVCSCSPFSSPPPVASSPASGSSVSAVACSSTGGGVTVAGA
jgi:hypothetical protein